MTLLKPDPTFYPSPMMATQSPAEKFAYVALINPLKDGRPDAIGVVDLDPLSASYGRLIGQTDMPNAGDELHHFGWNACSSCLCPYAPHAHMERRYLIVPGINSSRIHILDTKHHPRHPKIVKVIEPDTLAQRTGYAAPHTVHCGPEGVYVSALGAPDGNGPGGTFILDPETFEIRGRWELDRGPQELAYDVWWHLGLDTMVTSTWGTPNMVKDGVNPELLLAGKYGHKLHVWDLRRRRHVQELELGPEQQMALELRPAHDPTRAYGFASVVLSLKDLSSSIWLWYREAGGNGAHTWAIKKVIEIPAEPADPEKLPPLLQGFKAVAPLVTDINLSIDDRYPLRLVLWHRRVHSIRRLRSVQTEEGEFHPAGRHCRAHAAPEPAGTAAERRAADGRDQPRRQTHLLHQLTLHTVGRPVLSGRSPRLDGQGQRAASGRNGSGRGLLPAVRGLASAPDPVGGRRRLIGLVLLRMNRVARTVMDWQPMVLLGAYHGINPGMGWLFAVALGMQQGTARGVWRALPPIALGHAVAVSVVVVIGGMVRFVFPLDALKVVVAVLLMTLGLYRLWRHRHPRFGGMQVGFRDLTVWSFLMASAHGAGLMLLPFVMPASAPLLAAGHGHVGHVASTSGNVAALAVALHTLAFFTVMAVAAWVVYRKLGLGLLRKAWFNVDWLWAGALVVTGIVVLLH